MTSPAQQYLDATTTAPRSLDTATSPLDALEGPLQTRPTFRPPPDLLDLPVFSDLEFFLRPRFFYYSRDRSGRGKDVSAAAVGGSFGLVTGKLWDVASIGLTTYVTMGGSIPPGQDELRLLDEQGNGYLVLGEAYLQLDFDVARAKVFRQELDLPFINANDSRMIPNTFEAYLLTSKAVPNWTLGIGHVQRIKTRNSDEFRPMSDVAGARGTKQGVTLFGALYERKDDDGNLQSSVGAINQYGWDTFNTFYGEAEQDVNFTEDLTGRLQLQFADQRSVGQELVGRFDGQLYGASLQFGYKSFIVGVLGTYSAGSSRLRNPWGGTPAFNSMMISDFNAISEATLGFSLSYDFSEIGLDGLSAFCSYARGDVLDEVGEGDEEEFNLTVDYRPEFEPLKNLWLRFRYGVNDATSAPDTTEFRFIVNYSVEF